MEWTRRSGIARLARRRDGTADASSMSGPAALACHAPFSSMYLDPRGDVRACCQNEFHRLGNITERSLLEIWRGSAARRLRAAITADDLSHGCEKCAVHIDAGRPESAYARVFDWLVPEASSTPWPLQLELALSNACNLQCVMCNGDLSSSIRIHREGRTALPEVYDERFFAELDAFLPHLRSLVLLGGEPFLGRPSMRVLHRLVDLGLRPQCSITTNATQWNDEVESLVAALPMHLTVSIDGATRSTFESVRVGAAFDEVMANVDAMQAALARHGGSMSVSFCMMQANWHELGELLCWADDRELDVFVNAVSHPPHLSMVHADLDVLESVVEGLEAEAVTRTPALSRNRGVWLRELAALAALAAERRGRPVAIAASRGRSGIVARVDADEAQLIRRVDPGASGTLGLDLASLEGHSVWELVGHLRAALGETVSTDLVRLDDGSEERHLVFQGAVGRTVVTAAMLPLPNGQSWTLGFVSETSAEPDASPKR